LPFLLTHPKLIRLKPLNLNLLNFAIRMRLWIHTATRISSDPNESVDPVRVGKKSFLARHRVTKTATCQRFIDYNNFFDPISRISFVSCNDKTRKNLLPSLKE
jgi:hypothetical protein